MVSGKVFAVLMLMLISVGFASAGQIVKRDAGGSAFGDNVVVERVVKQAEDSKESTDFLKNNWKIMLLIIVALFVIFIIIYLMLRKKKSQNLNTNVK